MPIDYSFASQIYITLKQLACNYLKSVTKNTCCHPKPRTFEGISLNVQPSQFYQFVKHTKNIKLMSLCWLEPWQSNVTKCTVFNAQFVWIWGVDFLFWVILRRLSQKNFLGKKNWKAKWPTIKQRPFLITAQVACLV